MTTESRPAGRDRDSVAYARQHWISILNPSEATFHAAVIPLLAEAHRYVESWRKAGNAVLTIP
jgi:hypothetical protein